MVKWIVSLLLTLSFWSCQRRTSVTLVNHISQIELNKSLKASQDSCNDFNAYQPGPETQELILFHELRVNFHFLNTVDKAYNYTENEGKQLVKELIKNANDRLEKNRKMRLPIGNNTPVYDPGYRYVLHEQATHDGGIYFHYDDKLCFFANKGKYKNNYSSAVIDKYAIGLDSIINIFVMPHIPQKMRSKTYKTSRTGVALGNGLKIAGLFESGKPSWAFGTLLNHEVGHILGLRHTWNSNDGCEDTPMHSNCWAPTGEKPCIHASNNLMDYNNSQMAITPCQIAKIHKQFNAIHSTQRKLLVKQWCDYIPDKPIIIEGDIIWNGARDINRDILIEDESSLTIKCRMHMAKGAKIVVQPGAVLNLYNSHIHNNCGDKWGGIELIRKGNKLAKLNAVGQIQLEDVYTE